MDLPRRKHYLLRQLRSHEITLDEFLSECAEWAVETLGDIHFIPLPKKPQSVIGYENIPEELVKSFNSEYYKDHPEVLPYYEEVKRVKTINQDLYNWLRDCLGRVRTDSARVEIIKKLGEAKEELGVVS